MQSRLPAIKTLRTVFGDRAPEARRILEMTRAELEQTDAGAARMRECYHPPATYDLRMSVLDALGATCGVEGFQTRSGAWVHYLNAGDSYAPTVIFYRGRYRVACWGDIAERYGTRD